MSNQYGMHFFVSGKVQGVWFRASTKEQADKLSITGWARNLPDGRVEVLACGDKSSVAELHEWLKQGPPLANVTDLQSEEAAWQALSGFNIL